MNPIDALRIKMWINARRIKNYEIKENEVAEITSNEEIQVEEKKEVKKPKRKRKTKDIETNENNELKEE